jgi:dTMP kinase
MVPLITFEGGEGTGKSTQIRLAEDYLRQQGRACVVTREPGGTELGRLIRKFLLEVGENEIAAPTELFLYLADRAQHVQQIIRPALAAGHIVLCDRFTDSTLAYQGYGRGLELEWLRRLNETATGGLRPNLTVLLDCAVEAALARAAGRRDRGVDTAEDRFEREEIEFHERIRSGFLKLAAQEPERYRVIDTSAPMMIIAQRIRDILDRELA